MMRSREVRVAPPDGKTPILLAFGPRREGGALKVGLLFASAQLDAGEYHLFDPDDKTSTEVVTLPSELVDLPADKCVRNATLPIGAPRE